MPVGAGDTVNVVARPPDLSPGAPHVVVGAHLDTVPQAPGAEDNASGIAVLLELARLAQQTATRLPVVLVAFGAEEPRGPADDEHHFGSQTYVQRLTAAEEAVLVAMVSLDRVGAPGSVPVCTGGLSPKRVQRDLLDAAERIGVPARACENRTSDHWPFEKAGHAVARVGGNDSPGYHSAQDLPRHGPPGSARPDRRRGLGVATRVLTTSAISPCACRAAAAGWRSIPGPGSADHVVRPRRAVRSPGRSRPAPAGRS